MDRAGKAEAVKVLEGIFADSGVVVVAHYSGLTVAELSSLRNDLKAQGGQLKVIKNRLAKRALDGKGGEAAADMFAGPVAIAYSEDAVTAPKISAKFAEDNEKLQLVGAVMGEEVLDKAGVEALAKLPSLDELRGKLAGLLQAPASKLVGVANAPAGQLARVFGAYGSKDEAA